MPRYGFEFENFPKAKPKRVRGGIKARTQRGAFGAQWWAKRWIAAIEALNLGSRLARGRSYARAGQVIDIAIEPGLVRAKVQGSRAQPYAVSMKVATLNKAAWRGVTEQIASEARFAAKLLVGEMPHEIEEAFARAGSSLFPASVRELETDCSCPDWSNPCKHIAAVYYLLGEEFDRDPFLLFTLRGGVKADVLAEVSAAAVSSAPEIPDDPLPTEHAAFWNGTDGRGGAKPGRAPFQQGRSARRTLPAFPFWRGTESLPAFLAPVDDAARETALALLAALEEAER